MTNTTQDTKAAIEDVFSYHPPTDEQIPKYNELRSAAKSFASVLERLCPQSADRTDAFRKLRECVMVANASIALNGQGIR